MHETPDLDSGKGFCLASLLWGWWSEQSDKLSEEDISFEDNQGDSSESNETESSNSDS